MRKIEEIYEALMSENSLSNMDKIMIKYKNSASAEPVVVDYWYNDESRRSLFSKIDKSNIRYKLVNAEIYVDPKDVKKLIKIMTKHDSETMSSEDIHWTYGI